MTQNNSSKFNTKIAPTWCPGCGNYGIWTALKDALTELGRDPHEVFLSWDIGCFSNGANFTRGYSFHSLHGRAIPPAEGAKLANHKMTVLAMSGDGGAYGEGVQHFLHASRYNIDITFIVANNQRFSLTTGQASPTTDKGDKTKTTPFGEVKKPVDPIRMSIEAGASFVARGFAGDVVHLKELLKRAIDHKGFSHVDILQPCVTFNKTNTYEWFRDRVEKSDEKHDIGNREEVLGYLAEKEGKVLPIGVMYKTKRESYEGTFPQISKETLFESRKNEMKVFD